MCNSYRKKAKKKRKNASSKPTQATLRKRDECSTVSRNGHGAQGWRSCCLLQFCWRRDLDFINYQQLCSAQLSCVQETCTEKLFRLLAPVDSPCSAVAGSVWAPQTHKAITLEPSAKESRGAERKLRAGSGARLRMGWSQGRLLGGGNHWIFRVEYGVAR